MPAPPQVHGSAGPAARFFQAARGHLGGLGAGAGCGGPGGPGQGPHRVPLALLLHHAGADGRPSRLRAGALDRAVPRPPRDARGRPRRARRPLPGAGAPRLAARARSAGVPVGRDERDHRARAVGRNGEFGVRPLPRVLRRHGGGAAARHGLRGVDGVRRGPDRFGEAGRHGPPRLWTASPGPASQAHSRDVLSLSDRVRGELRSEL
mmetsp:Transcript_93081/g.252505  ORF Transcript_93081/g.252505 Transcript_93081/m.252505 type:complete len:207 (+) Transcript_93081:136-756(+)